MSHAIILDTYEYAKALKKANVPDAQIEVEVARDMERTKALNEIIDNNLATKQDILLLRKEFKNDLKTTEYKLTIRLGLMMFGMFTIGLTILGFVLK